MTLDMNVIGIICLLAVLMCILVLLYDFDFNILTLSSVFVFLASSLVVLGGSVAQLDDAIVNGEYDTIYDIEVSEASYADEKFIGSKINTPGSSIILYGNKDCVISYNIEIKTNFGPLKIKDNYTSYIKITTDKSDNILDFESLDSSFGKQLKVLKECGLDKNIYTSKDIEWIDKDGNKNILHGVRVQDGEEQNTAIVSDEKRNKLVIEL